MISAVCLSRHSDFLGTRCHQIFHTINSIGQTGDTPFPPAIIIMAQTPPTPGGTLAPPDKSPIFAFTAALALGFYLCTFVFTIRWLLFADEGWRLRKIINQQMVVVTVFIFVLTMAFTALDLKGAIDQIRLLMSNPGVQYASPMWMNISKVTRSVKTTQYNHG